MVIKHPNTTLTNIIAVTVLILVSGWEMAFQVAHGETRDWLYTIAWGYVWLSSVIVGIAVVCDVVETLEDDWVSQQVPPLFEEGNVLT